MVRKVAAKKAVVKAKSRKRVTDKKIEAVKNVKSAKTAQKEEKDNKLKIGIIALVVVIVAIIAFLVVNNNKSATSDVGSITNIEELNKKADVNFKNPEGASDLKYAIDDGDVARMEYKKEASDGSLMNFSMVASSSNEDENADENAWGSKIVMTVHCQDGSDVEVESYVSTEDTYVMKANWYDNDKYYMMTTDNLVTREDFLQEVNRVIIANHVDF